MTRLVGIILIVLSLTVSVPLVFITWQEGGGAWGFGIIGLPVLLPLSAYILFGIAAVPRNIARQRKLFIGAHLVTLGTGLTSLYFFPVYPALFVVIPVLLATVGIMSRKRFKLYLLLMISLAIAANLILLKWEFDFGRTLPILQLFESTDGPDP